MTPAPTTSLAPSPALRDFVRPDVLHSERAEHAVEIANTPTLRAEAERLLPAVTAATAPAGAEGVAMELGRLLAVFPPPNRSEEEWAEHWALYGEALGDLPLAAIKAGVAAFLRQPDAEFFPKPGPLRALCGPAASPALALRRTLEAALALEPLPDDARSSDKARQRDAAWKAVVRSAVRDRLPATDTPWLNGSGNLAPPVPL